MRQARKDEDTMKTTGIVRRLDDLGRITLPKELRRMLHIKEGDPIEIFTNGAQVVLQKYEEVTLDEMDVNWLRNIISDYNVDDDASATIKKKVLKFIDEKLGDEEVALEAGEDSHRSIW